MTEKIVTTCVYPPIPDRQFDWCAHRESYEPPDSDGVGGWPCGWGPTEQAAIADLLEKEEADQMIIPPREGSIRIVVKAGGTVRGTKYFEDTALDVSEEWARQMVAQGVARLPRHDRDGFSPAIGERRGRRFPR